MRTWFLSKVKYAKENEQGLLKQITEQYLVDAVSFTECEAILYDRLASQIRGDFQVTSISKSNIVDAFYYEDNDVWFKAKIKYMVADGEAGKEKTVTQFMIVTASDVAQAHERIQESLKKTLAGFRVPDMVETSIVEVFPFERDEVADQLPEGNWKPVSLNDKSEMDLFCIQEPVDENGKKVMEFTVGNSYRFTKNEDPEGWVVLDDYKRKEIFFDPYICFSSNHPSIGTTSNQK